MTGTLTAADLAEEICADEGDVRAMVELIGDLHDDDIPPDWADTVRDELDPGKERTRFFAMDLEEKLRWAAVRYRLFHDYEDMQVLRAAAETVIGHALSMERATLGTLAAQPYTEQIDAWLDRTTNLPRFGISAPAQGRRI